jgi:hypothetical protein
LHNLPSVQHPAIDTQTAALPAALEEIARVLADDGRVVLMTDDKRLFKNAVMHTTGLKIVRERVLRYGGVTPTVFVLSRTRRRPDRGSGPRPG